MPTILIIGSDSLIGRTLMVQLQQAGARVIGTTRRSEVVDESHVYLDLAGDIDQWQCCVLVDVVVICASVTKIEACGRDPVATARVNVQGVTALAKNLAETGAFIIYLSSNAVFDGTRPNRRADDPLSPVTEYGRQKAEVERQLSVLGETVSIVRFTKILEPRAGLLTGWLHALRKGEPIRPFCDMVMAPVPLSFASDVLCCLVNMRLPGVIQVSGERDISYAQAACHIACLIGARPALVQPISSKEAGIPPEAAPAHTTLDTTRLRVEIGLKPPDAWSVIDSVLDL